MRSLLLQTAVVLLMAVTAEAQAPEAQAPEAPGQTAGNSLGRLGALVQGSTDGEVLERLQDENFGAPGAYLLGRLLERRDELEAAAAAYRGIDASELPEAVAAEAQWRRGRLLARLGRCSEARPLLDAVASPRRRAQQAAALAAECAYREAEGEEQLRAAVALLQACVRTNGARVDTFALRMHLAEAWLRLGDETQAIAQWRQLYLKRPTHPEAGHVVALLEARGAIPSSPGERLERADALLAARRGGEAAALLAEVPEEVSSRRELLQRWLHTRGMALYKTRHHYAEAAAVLDEAYRVSRRRSVDDAFHAAQALSRADRDSEAIARYRRLARRHRGHSRAGQALYLAAWLELHHGLSRGERNMDRFLRSPASEGRRRAAIWHLAMAAYKSRRFRRAAELFGRFAAQSEGPMKAGKGFYWQGRAHHRGGRRSAAVASYRRARGLDPLHWYGLLARQRLEELGVEVASGLESPQRAPEALPAQPFSEVVAFYASLGLHGDAERALRGDEARIRREAPQGREVEALVAQYRRLGAHRRAFRLAQSQRRHLREQPRGAAQWVWEAAYPRLHWDAVQAAAERHEVPWAHVYATMRQESGYDPDAVSHADALGLLQVMPSLGARLATRMSVPFSRDRLFEPEWNIRFGVAEMEGLVRRFDGCLPLATAAYNAGTARTQRWIREFGDGDMDLFVEGISFDETRNYVRRVTSHRARYVWLADPGRTITIQKRIENGQCTSDAATVLVP